MKKIYILIAICINSIAIFAQPNPGQFQIRLTLPDEAGTFRVQYRAVGSVVPTTDNICPDLTFKIWWNNVANPGVLDIDIVQSTSLNGQINETTPPQDGTNTGTPGGTPGKVVAAGVIGDPFLFPSNWVLNQWVTVATVYICSVNNCTDPNGAPAGVDATDFEIQNYVAATGSPNINIDGEDYGPAEGPLPLDLVSFTAEKFGTNDALLEWTTVNEENTSHFTLQRSYNKELWFDVGEVKAAGFSTEIKNYNFTDYQVYNGRDARLQVYYRLNMLDIDGRQRYSPMQSVVFGSGLAANREFIIFPNPASEGVQVEWDANQVDQPTAIELYDVAGKLILSVPVSDQTNQQYIDFKPTRIQSGLYLMRIMHHDEAIEHKQIVVGRTE